MVSHDAEVAVAAENDGLSWPLFGGVAMGRIRGVVATPNHDRVCVDVEAELEAWTYAVDGEA